MVPVSGALDPQLHRHVVDALVGEFERRTEQCAVLPERAATFSVAWGLYAQAHRYARAALHLTDEGMAQEVHALVRIVLDFAVTLHWLAEAGDDGVVALQRKHAGQMKEFLRRASGTRLRVPAEAAEAFGQIAVQVSDAEAASTFEGLCRRMGRTDLYAIYGIESAFVHPSMLVSNTYNDAGARDGNSLRVRPNADVHRGSIPLIAHCLIWANRALDDLIVDHPARAGLERLAASIGAAPRLPDLMPALAQRKKRRGRRHRGRRA